MGPSISNAAGRARAAVLAALPAKAPAKAPAKVPAKVPAAVLAAVLAAATLAALGGPLIDHAAVHGQSPPPGPTATATAAPAPTRRTGLTFPSLPNCSVGGQFELSTDRIMVGQLVTGTLQISVVCPQALRSRSAVVLVGGLSADDALAAQSALGELVDALGEAGGSRVAIVRADGPVKAVEFAAVPAARAVIDAAIEALGEGQAPTAAQWSDQLGAAADALATLPTTQRPMLVVVDGARPGGDVSAGLASLQRVAAGLAEQLGLGLLIDLSPESWLRAVGEGGRIPAGTVLYIRPRAAGELTDVVVQIVDQLQAPIDDWWISVVDATNLTTAVRTRIALAPDWQPSTAFPWQGRLGRHELHARAEIVFRGDAAGQPAAAASVRGARRTASIGPRPLFVPGPLCVFAPGQEAECDRAAEPTVHPSTTSTPALPPSRPPTRAPTPPATPPAATRAAMDGRAVLPFALRSDRSIRGAKLAGKQQPRPTPGLPIGPGSIVGRPPSCDVVSSLDADPDEVAVGVALTVTMEVGIRCPYAFERAAALVAIGGIDEAAVPGVQAALTTLVDALGGEPDGRIAKLDIGQPRSAVRWAASDAERQATADAIRAPRAQPSPTEAEWATGLVEAVGALDAAPLAYRPILIVVQASAPGGSDERSRTALDGAAVAVRDRAGLTIVLDASPGGSLLGHSEAPPMESMIGVIDRSAGTSRLADGAGRLAALLNGAIERAAMTVRAEALDLDLRSASPPASGEGGGPASGFARWDITPAKRHHAAARGVIRAVGSSAASAGVLANVSFQRRNAETGPTQVLGVDVCVYPPEVGPAFCHPPTTEPPSPTPAIRTDARRTATPTPSPFVHPPRPTPTPTVTVDAAPATAYLPLAWR